MISCGCVQVRKAMCGRDGCGHRMVSVSEVRDKQVRLVLAPFVDGSRSALWDFC